MRNGTRNNDVKFEARLAHVYAKTRVYTRARGMLKFANDLPDLGRREEVRRSGMQGKKRWTAEREEDSTCK